MNYLTEHQFAGNKTLSLDVSGELVAGGNQLIIEGAGPVGATFGWRLTTEKPTIEDVTPKTAGSGETVTFTGTNLCSDPSGNTVTIGGAPATVVDANSKRLVVRVPEGLPNGSAAGNVVVGGIEAGSFKIMVEGLPTITGLSGTYNGGPGLRSTYQRPAQPFTIEGHNLTATNGKVKVTVGPFEARVINATANSLTIEAPAGFAGSPWGMNQPIKVWINGVRAQGALNVSVFQPLGEG